MKRMNYVSLFVAFAALAALALVATPRAGRAQESPPAAAEAGAHEAAATTQPAACDACKMCKNHLEMMAKLQKLLTEAKESAGTEAKATVEKIDEALKLLEKSHQNMHEQMKRHMRMMHRGMRHKGKMSEMKCPMCGQMLTPQAKVVNAACPITGKKFDPYNVPDDRTREFKGSKVGFCCPNCPPAWDKLSDSERRQKLDEAMKSSPGE